MAAMIPVRKIVALVLLALWPVITSHCWLQQRGLIHHIHEDHNMGGGSHEHNSDNHAFADGNYLQSSSAISVLKPMASTALLPFSTPFLPASISQREVFDSGLPPPGVAPPELGTHWQFSFRTALPIRAPSSS
jgi:hypothetical protein